MKHLLIISDTHGMRENLETVMERETDRDALLHVGDTEGDEDYIAALADCDCYIVAGNNDWWSDLPNQIFFEIEGTKFFMTHGHAYHCSGGNTHLLREGRKRGADVVIFGHTHRPSVEQEDGILIMNPGSLALPRQKGRRGSYILMDLEEGKEPVVEVKYV